MAGPEYGVGACGLGPSPKGSTERVRATTLFDAMNRLVSRTTKDGSGQVVRSFTYGYNASNQRVTAALETGESWRYGYDELGQVTSGAKLTATDQVIPGYDFGYRFDDIGNRQSTTTNGRAADYVANLLNQYEQREVPRMLDVLGQGPDSAAISVNDLPAVRTGKTGPDDYFFTPYPANAAGAHDLTIRSRISGTPDQVFDDQRTAYLAATPEVFTHDPDGNLTDDWRWHYVWNAENRLVAMETQPAAVAAGVPQQRLEFVYDYMGRRTAKRVLEWSVVSGQWSLISDLRFLYDGFNLLTELETDLPTSDFRLSTSFVWGQDLSGSLQGAGGVGGLVLTQTNGATAIPAYDGNGNAVAYVNLGTGDSVAEFEYGPFGEMLRATGSLAANAAFRFGTKFTDAETGLFYYGLRYYNPATGRWLSRDPIQEDGGINLYSFVRNNPIQTLDFLGLWGTDIHKQATEQWAKETNYPDAAADRIGEADEAVDGGWRGGGKGWAPWGDQSYHFDRNKGKGADTRLEHYAEHLKRAKEACSAPRDDPEEAAGELGTALHPRQDWVAHGDYGFTDDGAIWFDGVHNKNSPQAKTWGDVSHYPDNPQLDAVGGPDGRPAAPAMRTKMIKFGMAVREYAIYEHGTKRMQLTRRMTIEALREFADHVRANPACCRCANYFGVKKP